jgi:hypothetical protein
MATLTWAITDAPVLDDEVAVQRLQNLYLPLEVPLLVRPAVLQLLHGHQGAGVVTQRVIPAQLHRTKVALGQGRAAEHLLRPRAGEPSFQGHAHQVLTTPLLQAPPTTFRPRPLCLDHAPPTARPRQICNRPRPRPHLDMHTPAHHAQTTPLPPPSGPAPGTSHLPTTPPPQPHPMHCKPHPPRLRLRPDPGPIQPCNRSRPATPPQHRPRPS